MKTIPQPVDTETCQPARQAGTKANANLMNVENHHYKKIKKLRCMISKAQLEKIDINMLKHYSHFFIELS